MKIFLKSIMICNYQNKMKNCKIYKIRKKKMVFNNKKPDQLVQWQQVYVFK